MRRGFENVYIVKADLSCWRVVRWCCVVVTVDIYVVRGAGLCSTQELQHRQPDQLTGMFLSDASLMLYIRKRLLATLVSKEFVDMTCGPIVLEAQIVVQV
jgi:hypothetical protein